MNALTPDTMRSLSPTSPATLGLLLAAEAIRATHTLLQEHAVTRRLREEHRYAVEQAALRLEAMQAQWDYNLRFGLAQIRDAEYARRHRLRVFEDLRQEFHFMLEILRDLLRDPDLPDSRAEQVQETIHLLLQALLETAGELGPISIVEVVR